jgi:pimeloyl-ACP methyl ester carboxylesterase
MQAHDDDLQVFEAEGAAPLPPTNAQGHVEHDGARIWYASYGLGHPVILLHGGLGHSGNWGYQVPAVIASGYRAVLIDSRGHGRSTRDSRPYSYELMASDVLAIMDVLHLERACVVGWSDGACTALILATKVPARIAGVFFFACNMDSSGVKEIAQPNPLLDRCFRRHAKDGLMQKTQPNYSTRQLAGISVPVAIVLGEHDEFIKLGHAEYLARSIPKSELLILPDVSHFAPLQRPEQFNRVMLAFIAKALGTTDS